MLRGRPRSRISRLGEARAERSIEDTVPAPADETHQDARTSSQVYLGAKTTLPETRSAERRPIVPGPHSPRRVSKSQVAKMRQLYSAQCPTKLMPLKPTASRNLAQTDVLQTLPSRSERPFNTALPGAVRKPQRPLPSAGYMHVYSPIQASIDAKNSHGVADPDPESSRVMFACLGKSSEGVDLDRPLPPLPSAVHMPTNTGENVHVHVKHTPDMDEGPRVRFNASTTAYRSPDWSPCETVTPTPLSPVFVDNRYLDEEFRTLFNMMRSDFQDLLDVEIEFESVRFAPSAVFTRNAARHTTRQATRLYQEDDTASLSSPFPLENIVRRDLDPRSRMQAGVPAEKTLPTFASCENASFSGPDSPSLPSTLRGGLRSQEQLSETRQIAQETNAMRRPTPCSRKVWQPPGTRVREAVDQLEQRSSSSIRHGPCTTPLRVMATILDRPSMIHSTDLTRESKALMANARLERNVKR